MMNVLMKSDCRKFSPNIFNKSKCQNCFRTKEAHTAEALECNRATRKIAKCGYLFVAPDWDFTLSINRTKRWQRRWFVLYDDGELTYSVDEHPNTIPQALIDMNKVVEVSDAEQVTGNQFALAITAPERVHFVKGTSRDETKWWYDLLSHYPHGTVRARHKRNATFSGINTTSNTNSGNNIVCNQQEQIVPSVTERYVRSHSFSDSLTNNNNNINNKFSGGVDLQWSPLVPNIGNTTVENGSRVETNSPIVVKKNIETVHNGDQDSNGENNNSALSRTEEIENLNNLIISSYNNLSSSTQVAQPQNESQTSLDEKNCNITQPALEVIQCKPEPAKGHSRRYVKRENRGLRSQRSRSDGVAKMIPSSSNYPQASGSLGRNSKNLSDPLRVSETLNSNNQSPVRSVVNETQSRTAITENGAEMDKSPMIGRRRRHASMGQEKLKEKQKASSNVVDGLSKDSLDPSFLQSPLLVRRNSLASTRGIISNVEERLSAAGPSVGLPALDCSGRRSKPCSRNNSLRKDNSSPSPQIRGDPDGCQIPSHLTSQECLAEFGKDGTIEKKGWLLRLGMHKEWYKHWFVLKNSSLSYFRDPSAENSGIMDGILDLGLVKEIQESSSDRNHAFSITTWDNKKHILAALMPAVRSLWMVSISTAANIGTKPTSSSIMLEDNDSATVNLSSLQPSLLLPLLDERQRKGAKKHGGDSNLMADCSSSTSSDDHSEYFSVVDEDDLASRSSSPKALPPSPPINRTAISRVKQKARSRSNSRNRMGKRKLRSSSDISTASWEGGDLEDASKNEEQPVSETLSLAKDEVDYRQSTPVKVSTGDNVLQSEQTDSPPRGNHRNLVDKYNYLRKQLDEHACGESSTNINSSNIVPSISTENILRLLSDCRVCLVRVQEIISLKTGIEVSSEDLGVEWKHFKSVYVELDKVMQFGLIAKEPSNLNQKEIMELSVSVEKAREEIRRLKKDLKCSQDSYDDLELNCIKLNRDTNSVSELHQSQMALMTARVDDLTSKLTSSERSLRLAKQRVAKLEARQERRRSSLKGKEAVSLSKEFEGKLSELELKIGSIEMSLLNPASTEDDQIHQLNNKTKTVTDAIPSTALETSSTNMLLRLHSLDSKVKSASSSASELVVSSTTSESPQEVPHLLEKPKICLQVKGTQDDTMSVLGLGDESMEHWSSLSVTTSMSDLHTIEPEEEIPGTMEECLNALTQKLDILLTWLQSSFHFLANPTSYTLSGIDHKLPIEHSDAAKKLEDLLSSRGGMDETTTDIIFYLHLLQEASTTVKKLSDPPLIPHQNGFKVKSLMSRLKRATGKMSQILDLESHPQNFLDCVQKLLSLAFETMGSELSVDDVENNLEECALQLKELKNKKIDELTSLATLEDLVTNNFDENEKQKMYQPIAELQSELEELLDYYGPNCCNEFDSVMGCSPKKLAPMEILRSELDNLKTELGKVPDFISKSTMERLALVTTVKSILSVVHPSLGYQTCCISEEGNKWSINVLVGILEILLIKWTSQLIFQTASSLAEVLRSKETEVTDLKQLVEILREEDRIRKSVPCLTCCELQKQVCQLQTELRSYQRRMGQGGAPCERCRELHRRLEILSERHQMELASALDREREEHRSELQSRLAEIVLSHEAEKNQDREEVAKFKQEFKASENQVKALKKQFQDHITNLQATYDVKCENDNDKSMNEVARQRYHEEMEDLKCFCKRGLEAVENAHQLVVTDINDQHSKQLESLKVEKEKALAEESHATATALEVLRRTHREELRKALEKLRMELKAGQVDIASDVRRCCNLDSIKKEVLGLSEKYSLKCLEHSLLEEKLNSLNRQLKQSSQQVFKLLTHLSSNQENRGLQANKGSEDYIKASPDRLRQLLELRESQLETERGEKSRLAMQLHSARCELAQLDMLRSRLEQKNSTDLVSFENQRSIAPVLAATNQEGTSLLLTTESQTNLNSPSTSLI